MPKATFTFTLPKEEHDFKLHCKAYDLYNFVWDVRQYLREQVKHVEPERRDDAAKIYEVFCDMFSAYDLPDE